MEYFYLDYYDSKCIFVICFIVLCSVSIPQYFVKKTGGYSDDDLKNKTSQKAGILISRHVEVNISVTTR